MAGGSIREGQPALSVSSMSVPRYFANGGARVLTPVVCCPPASQIFV